MNYLYVAQGVGGLMKIGATKNPPQRRKALRREFRERGDEMARMEPIASPEGRAYTVEDDLIVAISKREQRAPNSREWFKTGNFENAVRAGRELLEFAKDRAAYFDCWTSKERNYVPRPGTRSKALPAPLKTAEPA